MKRQTKCIGAAVLSLAMAVSLIPGSMTNAEDVGTYSYVNDYTLGWSGSIAVYTGGTSHESVADSGIKVYDKEGDNPFEAQVDQAWDAKDLKLSKPVQYTTEDGKVHNVESMLTNFNFIADPTAIDNTSVDGKLYVYGTTEGFTYTNGTMANNGYKNHSLTILSTTDMVNWTDEGFMDSANLTNERSDSDNIVKGKFTSGQSWAPSGLKIDGDGDGEDEYYIFYTNGGAVGYVMGDSPTGPWRDPLGKALFTQSSPNCSGVVWCFDPGVLADDKGNAYVYFGGGTTDNKAHGKTGRVCKIKFEEGTGEVSMDGDPVEMDTYYFFEDNEVNQINGKYYYSYCANFNVPSGDPWTKSGSIAVYVSSDPLNIAFDPAGDNGDQFTDADGTYHHYLGTILDNPSVIYGQSYNNHHHMQTFKDHAYILYHSTELNNALHHSSHSYRNLHVDEITVDEKTDDITVEPTYEGAEQIENFNPYVDAAGKVKLINATTTSYSAGVKSTRDDEMVSAKADNSEINNGSPMVLDCIDTGDWTKLQGVDFGTKGAAKFSATLASGSADGAIELFLDDPTKAENQVAVLPLKDTGKAYETLSVDLSSAQVNGVHDVYFVLRGSDYTVASWKFDESSVELATPVPTAAPATNAPQVTTAPVVASATPAPAVATAAPATATPAPKAEVLKINKVTAKKKAAKVLVKATKGSAISVKVYKSLKLAKKGGKSGLVKSYTIKAAKNKTGNVSIKLKSKLRANQAVLVTISKSGCKSVKVAKKVK